MVDTTSAYTSFCGGILYGVMKGLNAAVAAVVGNAAASRVVASIEEHAGAAGLAEILGIIRESPWYDPE